MKTAYIVQSFTEMGSGKKSKLLADQPVQCTTEREAINRAERFADKRAGVLAIAQDYDETTGDTGELKVLATFGKIPEGVLGYSD